MRKLLLSLALAGSAFADLYIPCNGIKLPICTPGSSSFPPTKSYCYCAEWPQIGLVLLILAALVFIAWKYWFSKLKAKAKKK